MPDEIVRGEGHSPLDKSTGEQMPSIAPQTQRASLADFQRIMREKNEGKPPPSAAQAPAKTTPPKPETASSRMGKFQDALDAQQQQIADGSAPENDTEPPEQQTESETPSEETEQTAATLDDQSALAKYREWEQSDLFPEELLDRLHEIPVNGRVEYVDGKELRRGYQRGSDARRLVTEARTIQTRAEQGEQRWQQHFEAIKDPKHMLEVYERNGYGPQLLEIAYMLAERDRDDRAMVQAAADAHIARLGLPAGSYNHRDIAEVIKRTEERIRAGRETEIRERQVAHREQMLQEQQKTQASQQEIDQHAQVFERQLNQLRPIALRAYGIPDNKANRADFAKHLMAEVQATGVAEITRDVCLEAAKSLFEELRDARYANEPGQGGNGRQQQPEALSPDAWAARNATRRPRALPPRAMGGGTGKPIGGTGSKRGSLSDLEAMVAKSRSGG